MWTIRLFRSKKDYDVASVALYHGAILLSYLGEDPRDLIEETWIIKDVKIPATESAIQIWDVIYSVNL